MNAKLIATVKGLTTFKNSTTTVNHLLEIEGTVYMVEANCLEKVEDCKPVKVTKLGPKKDLILTGELKRKLEGEFLE